MGTGHWMLWALSGTVCEPLEMDQITGEVETRGVLPSKPMAFDWVSLIEAGVIGVKDAPRATPPRRLEPSLV